MYLQGAPSFIVESQGWVWDVDLLTHIRERQPTIEGETINVSVTGPLAVTGPLTDGELRATALPVSGPLTDAQLRASDLKITLDGESVPVTGAFYQATQPISHANLDAALSTLATSAKQPTLVGGLVPVDPSGVTQPISGTVTDGGAGKTIKSKDFSLSATGQVIAAVGGKRLKIFAVKLVVSAVVSVNWRDGVSTNLEGAQTLPLNGGYVESVDPPNFLFGTTAGNALDLVMTGIGIAAGPCVVLG